MFNVAIMFVQVSSNVPSNKNVFGFGSGVGLGVPVVFLGISTRDVIKLALPGFRHSVDWWGLPTRLEWALGPDRGALGYQTGSLAACMPFGHLHGPWVQKPKPSSFLQAALRWSVGLSRPAAEVLAVFLGCLLGGFPVHAEFML